MGTIEIINSGKKTYFLVKVGDEKNPPDENLMQSVRKILEPVIEATQNEAEWIFIPYYVNIEALYLYNNQ